MTDSARRPSETSRAPDPANPRQRWSRWASTATRLVILVSAVGAIVVTAATAAPPKTESHPHSNAGRSAGTWYELAGIPDAFRLHCNGVVIAVYRPQRDGLTQIVNRCESERSTGTPAPDVLSRDKRSDDSSARAVPAGISVRVEAVESGAGLVSVDDERYSVISDPRHGVLRILSRTPTVDAPSLNDVVIRLRALGLPVDSMVPTGQAQQRVERTAARRDPLLI